MQNQKSELCAWVPSTANGELICGLQQNQKNPKKPYAQTEQAVNQLYLNNDGTNICSKTRDSMTGAGAA